MVMAGYAVGVAGGPAVAVIDRWAEIVMGALKKERGRCLWVHPQTKREMVVSTLMDGGGADVISLIKRRWDRVKQVTYYDNVCTIYNTQHSVSPPRLNLAIVSTCFCLVSMLFLSPRPPQASLRTLRVCIPVHMSCQRNVWNVITTCTYT